MMTIPWRFGDLRPGCSPPLLTKGHPYVQVVVVILMVMLVVMMVLLMCWWRLRLLRFVDHNLLS
jgi:hypothetical protein